VLPAVPPQNVFHPVFELELALLQRDFFDLFRFGKIMLGGKFVQAIFEFVVLGAEVVEFLIRSRQLFLQIKRL